MAAAWNDLPATGGLHECAALVSSAEALRVSAPELSVQLARRAMLVGATDASSGANAGEIRNLSMRAQALLASGLVRISQHPKAVEPGFSALALAETGGAPDVAAAMRIDLAACAQQVGEPLLGGALLRPVLDAAQTAPAVRAAALGRLVGCVAHVARRDDVEDALSEADRLLAADSGMGADVRRMERARLAVRTAGYHRWYGDTEDAITAAREGLNLLTRVRDELRSESDRLRARLVLELVCGLLDEGELREAEAAAHPTVDEPVRATSAASVGRLMLAVATRLYLPSGQMDRGRHLLDQAAWLAERHSLDGLRADALTEVSRLDEQAGRAGDALEAMRAARAAEHRRMRAVSRAARIVLVEVGAGHGIGDTAQQSVSALMRQLAHPAGLPVAVAPPQVAASQQEQQRQPRPQPAAPELAGTVDAEPHNGNGLLDREGLLRRMRSARTSERPVALTLVRVEPNKESDRGPDTGIMTGLADKVRDMAPDNAELARSDGSELAVLLPAATRDQAEEFAATIRKSDWPDATGKDMSISTGVVHTDHTTTADEAGILTAARDAMTPAQANTLTETAAALQSALSEETPTKPLNNTKPADPGQPAGRSILSSLSIPTGSGGRRRAGEEQPPGAKSRWPAEPASAPRWTRAERRAQEAANTVANPATPDPANPTSTPANSDFATPASANAATQASPNPASSGFPTPASSDFATGASSSFAAAAGSASATPAGSGSATSSGPGSAAPASSGSATSASPGSAISASSDFATSAGSGSVGSASLNPATPNPAAANGPLPTEEPSQGKRAATPARPSFSETRIGEATAAIDRTHLESRHGTPAAEPGQTTRRIQQTPTPAEPSPVATAGQTTPEATSALDAAATTGTAAGRHGSQPSAEAPDSQAAGDVSVGRRHAQPGTGTPDSQANFSMGRRGVQSGGDVPDSEAAVELLLGRRGDRVDAPESPAASVGRRAAAEPGARADHDGPRASAGDAASVEPPPDVSARRHVTLDAAGPLPDRPVKEPAEEAGFFSSLAGLSSGGILRGASDAGQSKRSSYEETKAELAKMMSALNAKSLAARERNGARQTIPTPPEPDDVPEPPARPDVPKPPDPGPIPPVPDPEVPNPDHIPPAPEPPVADRFRPEPDQAQPVSDRFRPDSESAQPAPPAPEVGGRSRLMAAFDALTGPVPGLRAEFDDAVELPARKPAASWAELETASVVESPADALFGTEPADTSAPRSSLGAAFDVAEKKVTEPVKEPVQETSYDQPIGPEPRPDGPPRRGEKSSATIASLLTEAMAAYQSTAEDAESHQVADRFDAYAVDDADRPQPGARGRHRSPE